MSEQSERPQWAAEHTQTKEHEQGGVTYQVPPSVKQRLDVPLSAVPGSSSPKEIFACFDITAKYEPPADPTVVPCYKCVNVKFVSKDDPRISHEWNSGATNSSNVFPWQRMKSCCFSWPNNGPLRCLSRRLTDSQHTEVWRYLRNEAGP